MLLLTGATGLVGSRLLPRLLARRHAGALPGARPAPARERSACACRSRSATSPTRRRSATRCAACDTVVHLAAAIRDQPRGSIEELDGIATWRLVGRRSARASSASSSSRALGASTHHRARLHRAKALAEQAVREADMRSHGVRALDRLRARRPWLTLLERLALLPVMPVSGSGRAAYQPIWAEDVADCVMAALRHSGEPTPAAQRYELAGPETLSHTDIVRLALRARDRRRLLVHVPTPVVSRALRAARGHAGRAARSPPGTRPSCWRSRCSPRAAPPTPSGSA